MRQIYLFTSDKFPGISTQTINPFQITRKLYILKNMGPSAFDPLENITTHIQISENKNLTI
jgi:hypothetical protein